MIECFKIQLLSFDNEEEIFNIKKGKRIFGVDCLKPYFKANPTIIVADPFLFEYKGKLHLFYESKGLYTPGVLMMTSTSDLVHWSKPVVVLKEPFHLSYPWVFEEAGKVYMIPETGQDGSVRLYEATDESLCSFVFSHKLLEQPKNREIRMGYGDSSIYKKDGKYYLMTMLQYSEPVNVLELYMSDKLKGPYTVHPCSPITRSNKVGRDAGCWIEHQGKLLRVSQDCTHRYGDNVHVSEITKLSPTVYEEKILQESILPTDVSFYKEGGHQFNAIKFNGQWIVATDAKEYHRLLITRIIHKIKSRL